MTGIVACLWEALTGRPYYTGQQASAERGLPPSVTSGVAYAQVPEHVRHELWLQAKATDAVGRAAMAAELVGAGLMPRGAPLAVGSEMPEQRQTPTAAVRDELGGDRLLHR